MKDLSKHADSTIDREIARRTGTSIFAGDGRLKDDAASLASNGTVSLGEYLNLAGVPWAPAPDGAEHCQQLARLVEYMGELPPDKFYGGIPGGPLDPVDRKILHAVAMLYAVGRGDMGTGGELRGSNNYEMRSAMFAEKYLREGGGAGTFWEKPNVREQICHLIAKHNDPAFIREDKRLQVFSDALRYELVRIEPNTAVGKELLRRECTPDKFFMGWSQNRENFRQWMLTRGWK